MGGAGKDALAAFESYASPNNVRELEHILERAQSTSAIRRALEQTVSRFRALRDA
jgi:transcriptional regulator with GAF, ATPase, and Fis domain